MSEALALNETSAAVLERVVVGGDLSKLTSPERLMYYRAVCESVGLNPLTKPFEYITLNSKLTLYARRDCTDQLRAIHGVSVTKLEREVVEGCYTVTAYGTDAKGRTDSALGAVPIDRLQGEARANAMMKAETKAKRRLTLSLCGLGMLDESEVDSIPGAVVGETQVTTALSKPSVQGPQPRQPGEPGPAVERPDFEAEARTLFPTPAEEEERQALLDDVARLAKLLKLSTQDRNAFKSTYLGSDAASLMQVDLSALVDMDNALRARANEPKWGAAA